LGNRKMAIRAILLIVGFISLLLMIKYEQWMLVIDILSRFISTENGGLPGLI